MDVNVLELSDVRTQSSAFPLFFASLALLRPRRDVNAFYFGVLRRVAKGNTGGVTGEEEGGGGTHSRVLIGLAGCFKATCPPAFDININETPNSLWHHSPP